MNNDKTITIKPQTQPDEGEGHNAGQAVRGVTCAVEKARVRTCDVMHKNRDKDAKTRKNLQRKKNNSLTDQLV